MSKAIYLFPALFILFSCASQDTSPECGDDPLNLCGQDASGTLLDTQGTGINEDSSTTPDSTTFIDTLNTNDMGTLDTTALEDATQNGEQVCADATMPTGEGIPFTGYTFLTQQSKAYTFDCTRCPGGRAEIQGLYRYYKPLNDQGECEDGDCCKPNRPCGENGSKNETLLFEGNQWTRVTNVVGPPPGVYTGYYFCPDPAAFSDFQNPSLWTEVFVFETLPPQSQLKPGYSNPCHMKAPDAKTILFECNPQWSPSLQLYNGLNYCKVGQIVDGIFCSDPFL